MEYTFAIIIPIILVLTAGSRFIGISKRWVPVVSILLGVGIVLVWGDGLPIMARIIKGLIFGLAASGLWSAAKALANK